LDEDATVPATLQRAQQYVDAGADGIFVPGAAIPDVLRQLSAALTLPLNVLAIPGIPPTELGKLGVSRVSTGSLPYRAALHAALEVADAVRSGAPVPAAQAYPALQNSLSRHIANSDPVVT
jgi:2-methylisocitrate lyase-like PEP mutase family enzyme